MQKKIKMITASCDNRGFTLIEVVIAVVILTIGVLTAAQMQVASANRNTYAGRLTQATVESQNHFEFLAGLPYEDPNFPGLADDEWDDKDGDGMAGLDDDTIATADGNTTSPDGRFNLFWNVALNEPIQNTKTVRVIIDWMERGVRKTMVADYIKAQVI